MTVRRLGPGPHQSRGLDPGGCDADHGPKRRTKKPIRSKAQALSASAGAPRSGMQDRPPHGGLDQSGSQGADGPELPSRKLTRRGEQMRPGRAGGEPRSGEGGAPPGAPSRARGDLSGTQEIAAAVRYFADVYARVHGLAANTVVPWSETDAQFARTASAAGPRPISLKSSAETVILARMRRRCPNGGEQ
jgi:hypothetical protein